MELKLQRLLGKRARAHEVLGEYRRFLHLSTLGPVSPSHLVDEAWHLHLTYTQDYWERLPQVLGRALHHNPASSPEDAVRLGGSTCRPSTATSSCSVPPRPWPSGLTRAARPCAPQRAGERAGQARRSSARPCSPSPCCPRARLRAVRPGRRPGRRSPTARPRPGQGPGGPQGQQRQRRGRQQHAHDPGLRGRRERQ
ncbi:hypothetical protein ACFSC4_21000 [Deinococcus malanensis]|uniref:hypothetical protein n=1 Tax=Deinococcus malanensis TaxID=1706855 RepID=UPI0036254AB2